MGGKRLRVLPARVAQLQIKFHVHHRTAEAARAGQQAEWNIEFALREGKMHSTLSYGP